MKILIVDDEKEMIENLHEFLSRKGYAAVLLEKIKELLRES
ncbi:MAG: response regulator transcription factor [PVC group bacterium]|nr:response regulator transcription factor [PVC group bacterium]